MFIGWAWPVMCVVFAAYIKYKFVDMPDGRVMLRHPKQKEENVHS